jgi:hypothetical protein
MEIELIVTQSEYRAILMWIDEGGAPRNVNYRVIPDTTSSPPSISIKSPKNNDSEPGGVRLRPTSETMVV